MKTPLALLFVAGLGPHFAAAADVDVAGAWARGTVPGQSVSGAYVELTSKSGATLVGVAGKLAGAAELHEMKTENGVMKMRHVDAIELPAGKTVALAPGGYHIMLMDLKKPLKPGETLPLTLTLRNAAGKSEALDVAFDIRDPSGEPVRGHEHHHH